MAAAVTTGGLETAWRVVVDGAARGAYAGAVALVANGDTILLHRAVGWAALEPERAPMAEDAVFDLASLTKVVATLPVVLHLVAAGAVTLDDPVGEALPGFGLDGAKRGVTVRRLLAHQAGLTAWAPFYLDGRGPDAYLAAIARDQPTAEPGGLVVYSDLGFILLGELVRARTGDDVATVAAREVFVPLGMTDARFVPPAGLRPRVAASERGNSTEMAMCGDRAADFTRWRTEVIRGEAHDGNAWYGLGGIAGHAGLFGTAADLLRYSRLWLRDGLADARRLLGPGLVAEATRAQAPGRGLGWRVRPTDPDADAPDHALGPRAFGHTGFTGTSLWLDPDRDLVAILLTNRVHPETRPEIAAVRPAFHAALAAALPR